MKFLAVTYNQDHFSFVEESVLSKNMSQDLNRLVLGERSDAFFLGYSIQCATGFSSKTQQCTISIGTA